MVESDYNTDSAELNNITDEKAVGANYTLEFPDDTEVPVENVSFSEEANTSEVQYTGSFAQSIAVTGVTYSGSFDIPGNAKSVRDEAWSDGDASSTTLPKTAAAMTIEDSEGNVYNFVNVLLNSVSNDVPSDDRVSQSFDFMAERMYIT